MVNNIPIKIAALPLIVIIAVGLSLRIITIIPEKPITKEERLNRREVSLPVAVIIIRKPKNIGRLVNRFCKNLFIIKSL